MKNLENYNVEGLNAEEVKNVQGGLFGLDDLLIGVAIAVVAEVIGDWDNFKAGLSGQPPVN